MLTRALIVLLSVLNLGVAAWWITRPEPVPAPLPELPSGIARLELVEGDARPAPAPTQLQAAEPETADAVVASPPADPTTPMQCQSLGPYQQRQQAVSGQRQLQARQLQVRLREIPAAGASAYRVMLPPAESREQAQQLAAKIGAAGFSDYLIVPNGNDINGIALGLYRSRDSALKRQAALLAAGFDAQVQPMGEFKPADFWLDVRGPANQSTAQWQSWAGAAGMDSLDCALLR